MSHESVAHRKLSLPALTAFHAKRKEMQRALKHYDFRVDQILSDKRVSLRNAKFLERMWYAPRPGDALSFAQRPFREALFDAVTLALLHHSQDQFDAVVGPNRLRMVSTCPSVGYSDFKAVKLRMRRVRKHFAQCTFKRSLEGVGIADLALVHDEYEVWPSELGLHMHGICGPIVQDDYATDVGPRTEQSASTNKRGLAVVDVTVGRDPLTAWDVSSLTHYVTKISCGVKQEGAQATYTSQTHWTATHALRALEAYSHISPRAGIYSVGILGRRLQQVFEERIARSLKRETLRASRIDHAKLRRSWRRLHKELELTGLKPARLVI